jgi:hypothetical protein
MKKKIISRIKTLLGEPIMQVEVSEDMMKSLYKDAKLKFKFYNKLSRKKHDSIKKFWIENYFQSSVKESLAHIRGKYKGNMPIPGTELTLSFKELLRVSQQEKKHLISLLNE